MVLRYGSTIVTGSMYFINMQHKLMNNMRDYNSHTVVAAKKRITYKRYDAMLWKILFWLHYCQGM